MALHEPIEHRIGDRGVADPLVPVLDGKLAGGDGGAVTDAVIDDL